MLALTLAGPLHRISHNGKDARKALKIGVDNNDIAFLGYLKRWAARAVSLLARWAAAQGRVSAQQGRRILECHGRGL